ncbi:MAG: hypothetical protein QGF94_05855, partial [Candidatus Thalassarchaeaceae archaeon]|nr:hypothetical protein [Candidatus Thalassarchaeaceae archaeon]
MLPIWPRKNLRRPFFRVTQTKLLLRLKQKLANEVVVFMMVTMMVLMMVTMVVLMMVTKMVLMLVTMMGLMMVTMVVLMMVTMMVLMMVTIVVLMMVTIVVLMMVTMMVLMMVTYGSIPRTQIQKKCSVEDRFVNNGYTKTAISTLILAQT